MTTAPILVTGGTGTLGRQVVARLRESGRTARVLSRQPRDAADGLEYVVGNLATGENVARAVDGVETIVHCAGSSQGDELKAQRLVEEAARVGVGHMVYISVVGADRVPMHGRIDRALFGYFGSKFGAELAVASSGIPWTTLRATQFDELVLTVVSFLARLPVIPVFAGFRYQPVDSGEVANRLVELALGAPAGLVPDIAGPRIYSMAELVRSYLRTRGVQRPIVPVWLPGRAAAAIRAGATLAPDRAVGHRSWEEFLRAEVTAPVVDPRPLAAL